MLYIAVLLLAILFIAYRRYYPVKGIQCMRTSNAFIQKFHRAAFI